MATALSSGLRVWPGSDTGPCSVSWSLAMCSHSGETAGPCWAMIIPEVLSVHCLLTLKLGCAKHRATAIMEAVSGPETPMVVRNSEMLGVRRKGTGRLASKSPVASLISKRK